MGKNMRSLFTEGDIEMANKHMRRRSTSLSVRKMQIKITMICHCTPNRKFLKFKKENTKCW